MEQVSGVLLNLLHVRQITKIMDKVFVSLRMIIVLLVTKTMEQVLYVSIPMLLVLLDTKMTVQEYVFLQLIHALLDTKMMEVGTFVLLTTPHVPQVLKMTEHLFVLM